MFDINKTIMRCLTKNLAMFGLGLYIYAGEDLPENIDNEEPKNSEKNSAKKELMIQDSQKDLIISKFEKEEIKKYLEEINKSKLSDLTLVEASNLLKRKGEK